MRSKTTKEVPDPKLCIRDSIVFLLWKRKKHLRRVVPWRMACLTSRALTKWRVRGIISTGHLRSCPKSATPGPTCKPATHVQLMRASMVRDSRITEDPKWSAPSTMLELKLLRITTSTVTTTRLV